MENRLSSRNYGADTTPTNAETVGTISSAPRCTRPPMSPVRIRPAGSVGHTDATDPAKRARKERGPNWQPQEINSLIQAKRNLFLEELDTVDGRDLMQPDAGKWMRISVEVMNAGCSPCQRDGPACKSKWNQLIPEYKHIADFFARSGTNKAAYWNLTTAERKAEGLPRSFPQDVFFLIHDWYGNRPAMLPPHSRDLMSADDNNYKTPVSGSDNVDDHYDSDNETEEAFEVTAPMEDSGNHTTSTLSPLAAVGSAKATACLGLRRPSQSGSPTATPRGSLPLGVTPQLLSSSDTAEDIVRRRPSNTAVRRKSMSGHSLIAEATRATGDAMASQMKEMADASRDLEKSKIDVQLRLFSEQMEYQRERDRRLHDNARQTNENAKLAIMKQGEVVQCLADLSTVLSAGLHQRQGTQWERHVVQGPAVASASGGPSHVPSCTPHPTDADSQPTRP